MDRDQYSHQTYAPLEICLTNYFLYLTTYPVQTSAEISASYKIVISTCIDAVMNEEYTLHYITVQYSTVQYSTVQYSTSTVQ